MLRNHRPIAIKKAACIRKRLFVVFQDTVVVRSYFCDQPLMCLLSLDRSSKTFWTSRSFTATKVAVVVPVSHSNSEIPSTLVNAFRTETAHPPHVMFGKLRETIWDSPSSDIFGV